MTCLKTEGCNHCPQIPDFSHLILDILKVFYCTLEAWRAWKTVAIWVPPHAQSFRCNCTGVLVLGVSFKSSTARMENHCFTNKAGRLREGEWWTQISSYRLTYLPDSKSTVYSVITSSFSLITQNSRGAHWTDQSFVVVVSFFFPFSPFEIIPLISLSEGNTGTALQLLVNIKLLVDGFAICRELAFKGPCLVHGACNFPGRDQYSIMEADGWQTPWGLISCLKAHWLCEERVRFVRAGSEGATNEPTRAPHLHCSRSTCRGISYCPAHWDSAGQVGRLAILTLSRIVHYSRPQTHLQETSGRQKWRVHRHYPFPLPTFLPSSPFLSLSLSLFPGEME